MEDCNVDLNQSLILPQGRWIACLQAHFKCNWLKGDKEKGEDLISMFHVGLGPGNNAIAHLQQIPSVGVAQITAPDLGGHVPAAERCGRELNATTIE